MVRTNQGGSVLSFIVIGGALALLLIGGAYIVRQNAGPQTDTSQPQPATETPQTDQPIGSDDNNQTGDETDQRTSGDQPSEENDTPAAIPGTGRAGDDTPTSGVNAEELPQTGPVETIASLVALALLAGSTAAFVQSQRQRASL